MMDNIKSGTALDRILDACDPDGVRGDCATGVAAIAGALLAGRAIHYAGAPVTACNDHVFVGAPGAGKSRVIAALEAVAEALDVVILRTWPKSYDAAADMLLEAMQHRVDDEGDKGDKGGPRYETLHTRVLWILDEQGSLSQAQGKGDAAAMAVQGVQVAINMAADGRVCNTRAITRRGPSWPDLKDVTVIFARFAQAENGASMLAATRAGAPGAERRQAVWTVKNDPPRDARGNLLPPGPDFWRAQEGVFARCFDLARLRFTVGESFGARMSTALAGDLGRTVPQRITAAHPDAQSIHDAIEAAAHGDPAWTAHGAQAADLLARYWAGVRAGARGSTVTDDDDWMWAAAMVERIHQNAEAVLAEQDSEIRQKLALDEVKHRFARTPYWDSGEEPRAKDRMRDSFTWVGHSAVRQWAFWTWALQHLVLAPGLVGGRRETCFYRRHEPVDVTADVPRDRYQGRFLDYLYQIQINTDGPEWPLSPRNPE